VDDVVREQMSPLASLELDWSVGVRETLTTLEGERGVLVGMTATRELSTTERLIGVLLGDESYTLVDSLVTETARIEPTRELVRRLMICKSLGLGAHRPRRVEYAVPEGWTASEGCFATDLHAPSASPAVIRVEPARPLDETESTWLDRVLYDQLLAGATIERQSIATPLTTRLGLRGYFSTIATAQADGSTRSVMDIATLCDDRYRYSLRLLTSEVDASHHATFLRVVESVVPVPRPSRQRGAVSVVVAHWLD
jgi:hypothetical protein